MTVDQGTQWLRRASLVVQVGNQLYDLSALKFTFKTRQSDTQTPNSCFIRVYNLKPDTVNQIVGASSNVAGAGNNTEFRQVTLSAGYVNAQFGLVFQGTLKQTRRGRESAVNTYLDLLVADGDLAINWGFVNASIAAANATQDAFLDTILASMKTAQPGLAAGNISGLAGGTLPRGKVMFGMARDYARDLAQSNGTFWSIQNGKFQMLKRTAYLPGTSVVLNAKSGLIGQPEQTEEGIKIKCLLNPLIVIGSVVNIDNAAINQTINQTQVPVSYDTFVGLQLLANIAADGNYRAFVVEHEGDTRGNDWYTTITGLSVDLSAAVASAVPAGQV